MAELSPATQREEVRGLQAEDKGRRGHGAMVKVAAWDSQAEQEDAGKLGTAHVSTALAPGTFPKHACIIKH